MIGVIILFSFSVAASLLWFGGVVFYIYAKIGFSSLFGLLVPEIAMIAATTFLPIIFLWMVVGLLYNVITLRKQGGTINLLLAQTRRSADHAEAMVRTMMETQLQTRSALVIHNADLFINELNDFLSDIVVRLGLIQPAHSEMIWQRVGDGNRWAFCKVVLQNAENSPRFDEDLKNQLQRDEILSKAIRTFCYRFEQMFTMLERHDIEHYLTKIFEEGSLGKVYLRFVEVCREIDKQKAFFEQSIPAYAEQTPQTEVSYVYDDAMEYEQTQQKSPFVKETQETFEVSSEESFEQSFQQSFEQGFQQSVATKEALSYETPLLDEEGYQIQPETSFLEPKTNPFERQKENEESASPFGFLHPTR